MKQLCIGMAFGLGFRTMAEAFASESMLHMVVDTLGGLAICYCAELTRMAAKAAKEKANG